MAQIPINIADPKKDLQQVIAAENAKMAENGIGAKFSVQPLPQPGQGCRVRYVLWHSYSNGVPISKTVVDITFCGPDRDTPNSTGTGTT
jgi:hypothetical protein